MSYFAIVNDSDIDIKVVECHLNLWSLSALYHRQFLFDVGLRLRTDRNIAINELKIALPFGTFNKQDKGLIDLEKKVRGDAPLIFGGEAEIEGNEITYPSSNTNDLETVNVIKLKGSECSYENNFSGKSFSYWKLAFIDDDKRESDAYTRVRFRLRDVTQVWKWIGFLRSGATVDFRVSDNRGTVPKKNWNEFENNILEIETLNIFVISPTKFKLVSTSPPIYYIRVIEGSLWEDYLDRPIDATNREKPLIYQWRNEKIFNAETEQYEFKRVSHIRPFKVFLDLNKQKNEINLLNAILTAIFVILLLQLIDLFKNFNQFYERFSQYVNFALEYITQISLVSLLILVITVLWSVFKDKEYIYELREKVALFLLDAEVVTISIFNQIYSFFFPKNK